MTTYASSANDTWTALTTADLKESVADVVSGVKPDDVINVEITYTRRRKRRRLSLTSAVVTFELVLSVRCERALKYILSGVCFSIPFCFLSQ